MADKVLFEVYVVRSNRDLTEGRGPMYDYGYYLTEDAAYVGLQGAPKCMGVAEASELMKRSFISHSASTDISVVEEKLYGYRKAPDGSWGYGWTDLRDVPQTDPEYKEYLRLHQKFGNK